MPNVFEYLTRLIFVSHNCSSYLSGRSQRVMLNGTLSDSSDLNFGAPQGSCLGPILFTLYASKLFDIIDNHSPDSHCFADDTQLFVSFKPDYPCDQCEAGPFLTYKPGGANAPPVPPCTPPRNHIFPPQEKSLFPKIIQTNQRRLTNR